MPHLPIKSSGELLGGWQDALAAGKQAMELPPYMKVITGTVEPRRRLNPLRRSLRVADKEAVATAKPSGQAEVVSLISRQNLLASDSQIPTPQQAREALGRLQRDLPGLGQDVGDVHANLDRRRILVLLAPLVEG